MKKIIIAAVLAAAMALTGCGGEITEKANGALESAQNAAGDAIESKAADYVDGAVGNMEVPSPYQRAGGTGICHADDR